MPTVLVVDDSASDRRLVRGLIEQDKNWDVVSVPDGEAAIEQLEEVTPSLIVTDLVMPNMDGLDLVKAVKRDYPLVPVILMTAEGNEEIAVEALKTGATSYVPKHNLSRDLLATINMVYDAACQDQSLARMLLHLTDSEFNFELPNDRSQFTPLVVFLQRALKDLRLCDQTECLRVGVALKEALLNAYYHGNLDVGSELRQADHSAFSDLAQQRSLELPYRDRKIRLSAKLTQAEATFTVLDEGAGFDQTRLSAPLESSELERPWGRGVFLMKTFMDEVCFNDIGNAVTMTKRRNVSGSGVVPSAVLLETKDLDVEQVRDVTIVRMTANMADVSYSERIIQELVELVALGSPKKLLLNMADVEYIHSIALGRMVSLGEMVRANDGELRLCDLRPTLAAVLKVTQIDQTLSIRDEERTALEDWLDQLPDTDCYERLDFVSRADCRCLRSSFIVMGRNRTFAKSDSSYS